MGTKAAAADIVNAEDADKVLEDLEAELRSSVGGEEMDVAVHPFEQAQAYAMVRRDKKQAYIQLVTAARVHRRMKDHSGAETMFKEAKKNRDGILEVERLVAKEPAEVQRHYKDILAAWERDFERDIERRRKGEL